MKRKASKPLIYLPKYLGLKEMKSLQLFGISPWHHYYPSIIVLTISISMASVGILCTILYYINNH